MEQPMRRHDPIVGRHTHKHHALIRQPTRPAAGISFSTTEITSIVVSMVTLILAFHMFDVSDNGIILGIVFGITLHEIAHKLVAQSMGFESKYKLWEIGLVLVIAFAILSRGRFIFAAPGFVHTEGNASVRDEGIISLSAPAANILLGASFIAMGGWAISAAYVNVLLATFNLVPFGPLDGGKVMAWSPAAWTLAFGAALCLGAFFLL